MTLVLLSEVVRLRGSGAIAFAVDMTLSERLRMVMEEDGSRCFFQRPIIL